MNVLLIVIIGFLSTLAFGFICLKLLKSRCLLLSLAFVVAIASVLTHFASSREGIEFRVLASDKLMTLLRYRDKE